MNNRSLAIEISKHPLIKKLLEGKLATSSEVARLVVEELLREDLNAQQARDLMDGAKNLEGLAAVVAKLDKGFPNWRKLSGLDRWYKEIHANLSKNQPKVDKISLTKEQQELFDMINDFVRTTLHEKSFYLQRSDGSYSEIVNAMFWPAGIKLTEKGIPNFSQAPDELLDQSSLRQHTEDTQMWKQIAKAKSFSIVYFIKEEKLNEVFGHSNVYKVFNDISWQGLWRKQAIISQDKLKRKQSQQPEAEPTKWHSVPKSIEELTAEAKRARTKKELENIMVRAQNLVSSVPEGNLAINKAKNDFMAAYDAKIKQLGAEDPEATVPSPEIEEIVDDVVDQLKIDSNHDIWNAEPLEQISFIINNLELGPTTEKKLDAMPSEEQEQTVAAIEKEVEKKESEETTEIDPKIYEALKTAVKGYREEFYSQRWLYKQGEIVKNLIAALKSLTSPEMAAAFSKPTKEETVTEGEEDSEVKLDKRDIRNLKTDYTSFLEVLKLAKSRLKKFTEAAESGRAVSSVYKKDFLKIIQQVQNNVAELTIEVNKILQDTLTEAEEAKEELKPFQEIDNAYDEVTGLLSPIETSEKASEVENLPNTSKEALEILQSISHHFPSVNPFKSKDVDFSKLDSEFEAAITELKPFLYKVTDLLRKSTGGKATLRNSIEAFTRFSGEVQRIFGVKSDIEGIKPTAKPNAEAVEGEAKPQNAGEFKIENLLDVLEKNKDIYDKALKYIEESENLEEDKDVALRSLDKELSGQAHDLESLMSLDPKLKGEPKIKKTILSAAKKFVELYDNIRATYNTLKDKELGTETQAKLDKTFKKAERELDDLEKQLQGVIGSVEKLGLETPQEEEEGLEKIKQFFSSFAKKNKYPDKSFMSSKFTSAGKPLFSEQELEVINKFIDLLLKPESIMEAIGAEYEKAFQKELGISPAKIRSVFKELSPEEQKILSQALRQQRSGANLRTKKKELARMIRVKKKAKEFAMEQEKDEKKNQETVEKLYNPDITEDELAAKLNIKKEELKDFVVQIIWEFQPQESFSPFFEEGEENLQEQIANKLKPLIWETIRKNK